MLLPIVLATICMGAIIAGVVLRKQAPIRADLSLMVGIAGLIALVCPFLPPC